VESSRQLTDALQAIGGEKPAALRRYTAYERRALLSRIAVAEADEYANVLDRH